MILQYGKSVDFQFNAKDDDGNTAYLLACQKNHQAILELFRTEAKANGIDLNIKNKKGKSGEDYLMNK